MNLPPFNVKGIKPCGLIVSLDIGGDQWMKVEFVDEGGGYFCELKTEKGQAPLRIDADELLALATWCKDVCVEMDKAEK